MTARSRDEEHRASTPLELFFDLVFVVAIAQASSLLQHGIAGGDLLPALISYVVLMFGIWWAWMNFSWFASAYDCDDLPYRIAVFVQMAGALITTAGVPSFARGDMRLAVIGYVVMRLAMVTQWIRASWSDVERAAGARRYAIGIAACQAGWILNLFTPPQYFGPGFAFLIVCELLVPVWAESAAHTSWHPGHIAERYGLFTIIVLGESVLSLSNGIREAMASEAGWEISVIVAGGFLVVVLLWWFYFGWPMSGLLKSFWRTFFWGYGHYLIFGAAAAVGAGLAVMLDQKTGQTDLSATTAAFSVAIPVAIFIVTLWAVHFPSLRELGIRSAIVPLAAVLILLTPLAGEYGPLLIALVLGSMLAIKLATGGWKYHPAT